MKKTKTIDAVMVMREARDKVFQETKDMSPKELIEYYRRSSRSALKVLKLKKIER